MPTTTSFGRDFENLCRLCLLKTGLKLNIFNEHGIKLDIYNKIFQCLNLKVSEDDALPKLVCHSCVAKLEILDEFRTMCQESNRYLNGCLSSKKNQLANQLLKNEGIVHGNACDTRCEDSHEENACVKAIPSIPKPCTNSEGHCIQKQCSEEGVDRGSYISKSLELEHNENNCSRSDASEPQDVSEVKENMPQNYGEITIKNPLVSIKVEITELGEANEEIECDVLFIDSEVSDVKPVNVADKSIFVGSRGSGSLDMSAMKRTFKEEGNYVVSQVKQCEKAYFCEECETSFTWEKDLYFHHRRVHMERIPYSCSTCGQEFVTHGKLVRHRKTHTRKTHTRFECEICGFVFHRHDHLIRHKRNHSGLKPFACGTCGKLFARKDHLQVHVRICKQNGLHDG